MAGNPPFSRTGVEVAGDTVTLSLASPVTSGQPVTVSYDQSAANNPIQDLVGNDAAGLDPAVSMTNNTLQRCANSGCGRRPDGG